MRPGGSSASLERRADPIRRAVGGRALGAWSVGCDRCSEVQTRADPRVRRRAAGAPACRGPWVEDWGAGGPAGEPATGDRIDVRGRSLVDGSADMRPAGEAVEAVTQGRSWAVGSPSRQRRFGEHRSGTMQTARCSRLGFGRGLPGDVWGIGGASGGHGGSFRALPGHGTAPHNEDPHNISVTCAAAQDTKT